MSITIGLRFYRVTVVDRKSGDMISFKELDPFPFFENFVENSATFRDNDEKQRSWLLEPHGDADHREIWGYARYGTFGFTSDLVDRKTRKSRYTRRDSDLEEIPLFFHIWNPEHSEFGLIAFQSFQGRSCIQLVIGAMSEAFKSKNPDMILEFPRSLQIF